MPKFFLTTNKISVVMVFVYIVSFLAHSNESCQSVIYQAKEIVTMESGWPSAKFVLVNGDKVQATANTLDQLKDYKIPAECIDKTFKNNVIVPGFIEPHSHMFMGGITANLPSVYPNSMQYADGSSFQGANSPEKAIELIKHYVENFNQPGETLIIWGWDVLMMGGLHLDKHILNEVAGNLPLLIWDSSEHFFYANDAAMQKAKLTEKDLNLPGVISKDGEFTGQFLGPKAALRILGDISKKMLSAEYALPRMQTVIDLSAQNGITTTSELALGIFHLKTENELYKKLQKDQPSARIVATPIIFSLLKFHTVEESVAIVKEHEKKTDPYFMYRGIKFLFDDSFLGLSMMEEQYLDNRQGLYVMQPGKEIFNSLLPWWENDVLIHIHVNGTAANEEFANTLAQLQLAKPRFEPKLVIEHFGMTTPKTIERVEKLGAMASVNPYYLYYRSDINAQYIGADKSAKASRLKTMQDSGMTVTLHSDSPIGPPSPLEWMWIATNRESLSGEIKAPAERVTQSEALKMVTLNAAKALGIDDKVGSIEAGKWADFTVLDESPLTVEKEHLRDIKIWGTVLGGRKIKATKVQYDGSLAKSRMSKELNKVVISKATKKLWSTWQVEATKRQANFSF